MNLETCTVFVVFLFFSYCQGDPLVQLTQGRVIGLKVKSQITSVDYFSFRGIPYASPPTGDLRFQAPKPPLHWPGVLDARQNKNACMQTVEFPPMPFLTETSEDCLFLSVYTPHLPKIFERKPLLPVMVYIHGGGFTRLSSDSRLHGPDFFMREKVVLVVINYRLGVFGFLNLESPGAQGNAGLKDQIMALKWVRKEIRRFGGDPNSVTIFGNSSGGISVHILYLSLISQGLFHKAISQSGTAHKLTIKQSNYDNALTLAKGLNCSTSSVESVMKCLKSADAKEIIKTQQNIAKTQQRLVFNPTIEKHLGEPAVLPEGLTELNNKKYCNAPYMLGANKEEGIYLIRTKNYTKEMENLDIFLPPQMQQSDQNKMVEKIKQFYFNNLSFSNRTMRAAIDLYTDTNYLYGSIQSVRSLQPRTKVYLYQYAFDSKYKFIDPAPILKELNITGASHTDEVAALFYSEHVKQDVSRPNPDSVTILRMTRLWINFAKYGNPTPAISDNALNGVKWLPVSGTTNRYLEIDKELTMVNSNLEHERIEFWDDVYTSISSNNNK